MPLDEELLDGDWKYFATAAEMKSFVDERQPDVAKCNHYGPGWYLVTSYSQRCPRGCCYDSVLRARTAERAASDIAHVAKAWASAHAFAQSQTRAAPPPAIPEVAASPPGGGDADSE